MADVRIRFEDGRTGHHGLLGDPIAPGVYVVDAGALAFARECVAAELAEWVDGHEPADDQD